MDWVLVLFCMSSNLTALLLGNVIYIDLILKMCRAYFVSLKHFPYMCHLVKKNIYSVWLRELAEIFGLLGTFEIEILKSSTVVTHFS